jgi:hypothetical protein
MLLGAAKLLQAKRETLKVYKLVLREKIKTGT